MKPHVLLLPLLLCLLAFGEQPTPSVALKKVATGYVLPILVLPAPGDANHLYVVDSAGLVKKMSLTVQNEPTVFLDCQSKVNSIGEQGLVGFAFHPSYEKNHRIFLSYRPKGRPKTVRFVEYHTKKKKETLLFENVSDGMDHTGGHLVFGTNGLLYIATGDGNSNDEDKGNDSQNLNGLLGKMLRIDVDKKSPYGIPADNPLVGKDGRDEIFAWGLRHPWRYSIDGETSRIYAGDNGVVGSEEINLVERGGNYGWNIKEGSRCYKNRPCDSTGLIDPVHEYQRKDGYSVIGGYVYRGKKLPDLVGKYVFGDFGTGNIWTLELDSTGTQVIKRIWIIKVPGQTVSFGEDASNELYVLTLGGGIFRIEPKS